MRILMLYKRINVARNVEKIRLIKTVQMNERRRNVEKVRLILQKRTNVRRNFEKIRLILHKRTNEPRTIDMTTVIQEMGTYYDMEKRPEKTNTVRTD